MNAGKMSMMKAPPSQERSKLCQEIPRRIGHMRIASADKVRLFDCLQFRSLFFGQLRLLRDHCGRLAILSGVAATHVGVGVVMVVVTALALVISLRSPGLRHRIAAGLSLGSTLGAALAGAVYIYDGKSQVADAAMGGLTLIVLIAVILLFVWGSVAKPNLHASAA